MKREIWTEAEICSLPVEEPNIFDRKAGKLFDKQDEFLNSTAKALSASANSGGGSLLLGVSDDGTFDGLPHTTGRTSIRDWIEQKIPSLLEYPLSDFRVHTVIEDNPSLIPKGRKIIVIDVGDSAAAPHQSKRDHKYYYRVGGRSLPAPHFYLELLRQRLSYSALRFAFNSIIVGDVRETDQGIFVEAKLKFLVENVGRVAAYEWLLKTSQYDCLRDGVFPDRARDYRFSMNDFAGRTEIPIMMNFGSRTILPGCQRDELIDFGFQLRPKARTVEAVKEDIELLLMDGILFCQLATEASPGELVPCPLSSCLDVKGIESAIRNKCPQYYHT